MTAPRVVWFHREYARLTGGHVKHAHYFEHVSRLAGYSRRIVFDGAAVDERLGRERAALWPAACGERATRWQPGERDILFLAGTDWRYHAQAGLDDIGIPHVNLIQHVRHGHPGTELHGYLDKRAVRICVSDEVADAIRATGRANGPVLVIPNGTDRSPAQVDVNGSVGFGERAETVTIVGYKRGDLAAALSRRLDEQRIPHLALGDFIGRDAFLSLLERTRIAVCLPRPEEGFYLPALEAMAAGCTVITLDCVGNRSFCRNGHNCLVAEPDPESLARAVGHAAGLTPPDRRRLHANAADTVQAHSLETERKRFHEVLLDIDRLWKETAPPARSSVAPAGSRQGTRHVDFMIVGAQKCGTSALARFLSAHPAIAMAAREGHIFDAPDYSTDWSAAEIDRRYARRIDDKPGAALRGESTPFYMYLADIPRELRRYSRTLKLIVMLRDPVERALSHYAMERSRGNETRPLWLALLAEPWRRWRCRDPRAPESAARRHSYRSRGLYSVQLQNLFAAFPRDQVLVVQTEDLLQSHDEVLEKVFVFLGVSVSVRVPPEIVFAGVDLGGKHALMRWLLRLSFAKESRRLRAILTAPGEGPG
ncbi:MAG: sulfotransferase domain-containing protein [Gammaproteobacteria bacterium]|nr:sulfotransferase domain-containing protein [Gammaproteobacteria bacterium]